MDKFNKPKSVNNQEAIYTLLARLILLEKGTIQSHPDMGVGIVSRYRYSETDKWRDLQQDIEDQIFAYLPDFTGVRVKVSPDDRKFNIEISIDGVLYKYIYNTENITLEDIRTQ